MEQIIKILMKRDGLTREEAKDLYNETQEMILEASQNPNSFEALIECESILASQLGLEPDYLFNFIG